MRLGLFGGTFNPVHCGHLRMAVEAREALELDRVDFVLAARPPHKPTEGILPFETRWRLLSLALDGMEGYAPDRSEELLDGPSYTVRTLETFRQRLPDVQLWFICGTTDFVCMDKWMRGQDIPVAANIAVLPRPGADIDDARAFAAAFWPEAEADGTQGWRMPGGNRIRLIDAPLLDISATMVRERLQHGRCLTCLVPPCVAEALWTLPEETRKAWLDG